MDSFEMPDSALRPTIGPVLSSYDDRLKDAATLLRQHLANEIYELVKAGDTAGAVKASDVEAWDLFKTILGD